MNARTAPAGADRLLDEALAAVSEATGLRFVLDGPTTEAPSRSRLPYQPKLYGKRWPPVLIAWSDAAESDPLVGGYLGYGGSHAESSDDGMVYVTGSVVLDGPDLSALLRRGGTDAVRAVLMHELGHLVGLAHVDDPNELMHADPDGRVDQFGPGDLSGLAKLGGGRCLRDV